MEISSCEATDEVSCCKLMRYKIIFTEVEVVHSNTMPDELSS